MTRSENNQVIICGEIVSPFVHDHTYEGEKFYSIKVIVQRTSGTNDILPVMVSERMIDVHENCIGKFVNVTGEYHSFNKDIKTKKICLLFVFAKEIEFVDEGDEKVNSNSIHIEGYVCKEPEFRVTPRGREITNLCIAVNRRYGKSDYIPCLCWERNARYAAEQFKIGTKISFDGRIQSRDYLKKYENGDCEERTTYEVSIRAMEVDEGETNEGQDN